MNRPFTRVAILFAAMLAACCGPRTFALSEPAPAEAVASEATSAPARDEPRGGSVENGDREKPIPSILDDGAWWDRSPLAEPLETDRPDFTEGANPVPRGHLQLEGGYTFTYDREKGARTRSHTAPELLLRVGLIEDLELRIGWEGYTWLNERSPGETRVGRSVTVEDWSQGGADTYLGFKWKLIDQEGLRPDFAIIPAVTVPTGGGGFSSGDVDPEIKLAWAYDLSDRWALAGNVNLAAPTDEKGRFFQAGASVAAAYAILDDVGAYFEYYGFYPNARDADCAHTLNTGLTWQMTPNFQLDWRVGAGLNEEADDFFTGAGFAIRF